MKPIALNTNKLHVLVIGYGLVGKRKATDYKKAGAQVTTVDEALEHKADYAMSYSRYFECHKAHFLKQHLVIIATSDFEVNCQIESDCLAHYKLYNRVDNGSGFFSDMSYHITENYMIAASGLGKAPNVSKFILEKMIIHLQDYKSEITKRIDAAFEKRAGKSRNRGY